jgi:hypothetical protein
MRCTDSHWFRCAVGVIARMQRFGGASAMVVIQKRRLGFIHYSEVYFARPEQLVGLVRNLRPFEMLYVFFAPVVDSALHRCLVQDQKWTTFVDLSHGADTIWRRMHASCRYKVRRAEKMRDRFEIALNTEAALTDFRQLYDSFARAKGNLPLLTSRSSERYLSCADVFVLYFNNKATCGRLVLRDVENQVVLMMHSATRRLEPGADTITIGLLNRYLHWYEMQTYLAAGIKRYDFGGAGESYPSVTRFKLSFGGQKILFNYCIYARNMEIVWKVFLLLRQFQQERRLRMRDLAI